MFVKSVEEMLKENKSVTAMRAYYMLMLKYGVRDNAKLQPVYDSELQKLHRLSDKLNYNWSKVCLNAKHIVAFCEENASIIKKKAKVKKAA